MRTARAWMLAATVAAVAVGCSDHRRRSPAPDPGPAPVAPLLSGVTPVSGDVAGGTVLTLSGSGFVAGATITVGGTAATSVSIVSATQANATTPAGSVGSVTIVLTNPGGLSASLVAGFTYTSGGTFPAPTLTAVSPNTGPVTGGQTVTLTGTGFQAGATVTFGAGTGTSVTLLSGSTLTCVTPTATAGPVNVVVTNTDAQFATLTNGYTYGATPTVSGVTPATGDTVGGTPVTVAGTGFATGATVTFGASAATNVVVLSSASVTCQTPASATGAVTVTVTNPGGAAGSLASAYTYTSGGTLPTVSNVNPSAGPAAGGTTITLTGSAFGAGATVTIGGATATGVTVVNSTTITCVTPRAPVGTGAGVALAVTVTNTGGASGTNTSPGYAYLPAGVESLSDTAATPDVAVDGAGNLHLVWHRTTGGGATDILYVRSTDGGQTWTATPVNLSNTTAGVQWPRVASRGNTVMVVWDEGTSTTNRVASTYSSDNGANWASVTGLGNGNGTLTQPDVGLDANGKAYVAFLYYAGAGPQGASDLEVYHTEGTPGGTFSTAASFGSTATSWPPSVAADGSGNVLIVWTRTAFSAGPSLPYGSEDIYYGRTTNGGTTWTGATVLINDGNSHSAAAVALRGSTAIVSSVWFGQVPQTGTQAQMEAFASTDTGATWGGGVMLTGALSGSPAVTAIAADAGGTFTAVWDVGTDIWESLSTDGGQTWAAPVNRSNNAGTSQTAQVASGAAGFTVIVWADDTAATGTFDVLSW